MTISPRPEPKSSLPLRRILGSAAATLVFWLSLPLGALALVGSCSLALLDQIVGTHDPATTISFYAGLALLSLAAIARAIDRWLLR